MSLALQARARGTGPCSLETPLDFGCHFSLGLIPTCECPFSTPLAGRRPFPQCLHPLWGHLWVGTSGLVPGFLLFPTPPPGRGPFVSLTPREPSSLGLVALSPVAARLGVLTADRRHGKAREASCSCGAPGLTPTWSCPLVAELLESLSTQP